MASVSPAGAQEQQHFQSSRLERLFADCFYDAYQTCLIGGADEPYYQPATGAGGCHSLYYRSDYFASALHEVAHWCMAGTHRRAQADFGYWYAAGDRTVEQQGAFEKAESRPQGLEWIFSKACNFPFTPSADNLELARQGLLDTRGFSQLVLNEALAWQIKGLGDRAQGFYRALCIEFGTARPLSELHFELDELL